MGTTTLGGQDNGEFISVVETFTDKKTGQKYESFKVGTPVKAEKKVVGVPIKPAAAK